MSSGDSAPEPSLRASVIPLLPVWRVDRVFDYLVPPDLEARISVGHLVRVPFGNRNVRGIVVGLSRDDAAPGRELASLISLVIEVPLASPAVIELVEWVARRYAVARGVAYARLVPPRVRVRVARTEPAQHPAPKSSSFLNAYEQGIELVAAVARGETGVWVLRALPGHARGHLIGELADAAAQAEGATLVAVPEVKYGSAVLDEIANRGSDLVRVDSSQDEGVRSRAWVALAAGHPLGGGGRSAVLAPSSNLRLIVLDEEHHHSFKEDRSPRYDARRVAVERARLQGALCVLVSSTPSLESGLAVRSGRWKEVAAPRSLQRKARPIVEVVEPALERALTSQLHERIRDTLRAGGRVGLLVPSRGYARALWCAACKRSLRCPRCEAGMFFDRTSREGRRVRCARCGLTSGAPSTCPTCGSAEWRYLGAGSERLAEQVGRAFPRARVERMDPDVLAAGRARTEDPDIYVTTWIGTKPVLRPDVALVGVLDADALIRRPDFRAAENAYQALAAMSEWAGGGGRLLIQCSEPAHHAVQSVVRADHDFFVDRELEQRRELSYPPFAELVKVTAAGTRTEELMAAAIDRARRAGGRVLGPIDVPAASGNAREILVKARDATRISDALRELLASVPGGDLKVDADPR